MGVYEQWCYVRFKDDKCVMSVRKFCLLFEVIFMPEIWWQTCISKKKNLLWQLYMKGVSLACTHRGVTMATAARLT